MTKATHDGTCQICGSRQRLPRGRWMPEVLAKHGYTTRWGYFTGTCVGSGYLPFELSTDQIEAAIERAEREIATLAGHAADLRNPAHELNASNVAWWHQYVPASYSVRHSSYTWIKVAVADDLTFAPAEGAGKHEGLYRYSLHPKTVAEAVLLLNGKRADAYDASIKQLATYVRWQRERIIGWTAQPLLPRGK